MTGSMTAPGETVADEAEDAAEDTEVDEDTDVNAVDTGVTAPMEIGTARTTAAADVRAPRRIRTLMLELTPQAPQELRSPGYGEIRPFRGGIRGCAGDAG